VVRDRCALGSARRARSDSRPGRATKNEVCALSGGSREDMVARTGGQRFATSQTQKRGAHPGPWESRSTESPRGGVAHHGDLEYAVKSNALVGFASVYVANAFTGTRRRLAARRFSASIHAISEDFCILLRGPSLASFLSPYSLVSVVSVRLTKDACQR